ncbi:Uncharacterised protein [Shigella sonnei]|nr:Uncharacterised protein [Shigella sonnei]CSS59979.1 Uncharacterised protein [Shigella sonnei]CST08478.1 Uncharacterised protein [Shigella sonnei]SRN48510.1 Uncharacterised protein [Shigella flexneri]
MRAIFKTETEVTLFAMTVVIFKPSLTAATKVFNQCPVGGRFPPKGVGKTAGRAENLYRNVVTFAFRCTNFRRVEIVRITRIIKN